MLAAAVVLGSRRRDSSRPVASGGLPPTALRSESVSADGSTTLTTEELTKFLAILEDTSVSIECVVPSALCDIAMCSLNDDVLTANCGCMAMPADSGNPATLELGWGTAVLAQNPIYREVCVRICVVAIHRRLVFRGDRVPF